MDIDSTGFNFIDKIKPPVKNGEYTFTACQTVTPENDGTSTYTAAQKYAIAHSIFTLGADEVFGTYPLNGAVGYFGNTLPFITFEDRSLPWMFGEEPFMALLVLKQDEIISRGEITVGELFNPIEGTYFPAKADFPAVYPDEEKDYCEFIDISRQTYKDIFPSPEDIGLLTHSKYVELDKATDDVCAKSGYFSEIIANRFVLSAEEETISSCCLVSAFGYGGEIPDGYEKVRLICLYSWSVRSKSESGKPFSELIKGLSKNSGAFGKDSPGTASVKIHYTRTGEKTYSIYHSPLTDRNISEIAEMNCAKTADGRLIYDKEHGVLDVSYAAAYQLGRLITLQRKEAAAQVLEGRNSYKMEKHQLALKTVNGTDFKKIAELLVLYDEECGKKRK